MLRLGLNEWWTGWLLIVIRRWWRIVRLLLVVPAILIALRLVVRRLPSVIFIPLLLLLLLMLTISLDIRLLPVPRIALILIMRGLRRGHTRSGGVIMAPERVRRILLVRRRRIIYTHENYEFTCYEEEEQLNLRTRSFTLMSIPTRTRIARYSQIRIHALPLRSLSLRLRIRIHEMRGLWVRIVARRLEPLRRSRLLGVCVITRRLVPLRL